MWDKYFTYTFVCVLGFLYWLLLAYSLYIAWKRSIIAVSHMLLPMSHFVSIFPSLPVMISVSHLIIVFHSKYLLIFILFCYCCIAGNRSWLCSSSQDTKIIMYKNIWCTAVMWKFCKFLAVRPVARWPFASVVLTVRFPIKWSGVGWEQGPPEVWELSHLLNSTFWHLTLSTPKTLSHGLVICTTGSHSSSPSSASSLPSGSTPAV
jgi:hypothetical protein